MSLRSAAWWLLLVLASCADADVVMPDASGGGQVQTPQGQDAGVVAPHVDARPCSGFDYKGHCYTLHETTQNVTWLTAKTACENERPGGHLVTFESAEEAEYATGGLKPQTRGWIGLNDRSTEGTFAWVTSEPVTYTNWRNLEPSNGGSAGNEDCVAYSTPADSWAWNDLDCGGGSTQTLSYICELD